MKIISYTNFTKIFPKDVENCYLLYGTNFFLVQESIELICSKMKKYNFDKKFYISLNKDTNWKNITYLCTSYSLFDKKKILIFTLPENKKNSDIHIKLINIISLLHKDLLIIIIYKKEEIIYKKNFLITSLSKINTIFICCNTPKKKEFPNFIYHQAKKMNLDLDLYSCKVLCDYYEGNLLALNNIFKYALLIYPDGKLTLYRITNIINNESNFSPYHWISEILNGNITKANNILHQLRLMDNEPLFLLTYIKKKIFNILKFKNMFIQNKLEKIINNKNKCNVTFLIKNYNRISFQQLHKAIMHIINIEYSIKNNIINDYWCDLYKITHILCKNEQIEKKLLERQGFEPWKK